VASVTDLPHARTHVCAGFYTKVAPPPKFIVGSVFYRNKLEFNDQFITLCNPSSTWNTATLYDGVSKALHQDCDKPSLRSIESRGCKWVR
jgi:hypothetical protein